MNFEIFRVRIDDISQNELLGILKSWLLGSEQKMIVTPNAEFLLCARRDRYFTDVLNMSHLSLPDGVGLVYAVGALTDDRLKYRHTGVDTLHDLAKLCQEHDKRLVLFGGNPMSAEKAARALQERYPGLDVIGIDPGSIPTSGVGEPLLSDEMLDEIKKLQPAVLAVALGAKKQELMVANYLSELPSVRIAIGVGGALESISGTLPRAPEWMRSAGLEWLWRLRLEPKRFKRIVNAIIVFPGIVAWDTLRQRRFLQACRNVVPEVWKQISASTPDRTPFNSPLVGGRSNPMKARTRIAPSPTGFVHIGTLRTALFNYFLAQQTGGEFIIRIEDTDRERFVEGATEAMLRVFKDLGLEHDEGPFIDENGILDERGPYGPYTQSQRLKIYQKYIDQLLEQRDAYLCFCSKEQLNEMRKAQKATKQTPKYDGTCRRISNDVMKARLDAGEPYVVRMKIPEEGSTEFEDLIRGKISVDNKELDDQVILKSDGFPTYHLAVVVDDHLMKITHVIRGEEWLASTPKHIILYRYFGFDLPVFAHVALLLNPDKSKLSKRQGDVAVEDYFKRGYLPKALLNFVATLGYNPKPDQEIYDLDELVKLFDLKKVNKSGAVLNMEKLDWMNNHYLRQLSEDELAEAARSFVQANVDDSGVRRALMIERERVNRLDELQEHIDPYLATPRYDSKMLVWKKADVQDAKNQLTNIRSFIEQLDQTTFEKIADLEKAVKQYIEDQNLQSGNVLWPLRVALSGQERSASPFEYLWALGSDKSLARLDHAIAVLV
ncbi:glutamate--tRNA ligase [Patescibacteria group bacterium]|nr:glutamate--tRNA ligase [Patescibacteria group bacterium]